MENEIKVSGPQSWGFATACDGNQIASGWQGYEDQARALAQTFADDRGEPISVWLCADPDQTFDVEPIGVVETRAHRASKRGAP